MSLKDQAVLADGVRGNLGLETAGWLDVAQGDQRDTNSPALASAPAQEGIANDIETPIGATPGSRVLLADPRFDGAVVCIRERVMTCVPGH